MKPYLNCRTDTTCLLLLIVITIAASSGCTGAGQDLQNPSASAGSIQAGQPVADSIAVPAKTAAVPSALHTPGPVPFSSTGVITIDPVTDKKTGDKFTLTGTTDLRAETIIFWQILPDTGSPPAGLDGSSTMSVGGNYQVTRDEGTTNKIAIAVDLNRLVPGKYVAFVGKAKEQKSDKLDWEVGTDFAFAYFSLKQT